MRVSVVVIDDLVRKPVPFTDFRVVSRNGDIRTFRTDEAGTCRISMPPGEYSFESASPLNFKGRVLNWKMPLEIRANNNDPITFTDADASAGGTSNTPKPNVSQGAKIEIAEGTKIRLELAEPIASNRARKGDEVRLFLKDAILGPNKEILVKEGAAATGTITYAKGAGSFGKKGKLEFSIDSLTAADGTKVQLRSSQTASGKNNALGGAAGMILLSPLMGFVKGKNITLESGTKFDAYIDKTVAVSP